ncbi:leucyl/phenylalanyl-tRNA--protein transferase [Nocardioides sp. Kera G14]|uniref:leucyl/phenylalanyl-tRNA--protein transferase n=1 Tax=Nocardioides sp. Kera G14 TaxID=2884264 RepID=UPI001D108BF8|nr:leucyl/phenylalanyl-tRNA--protein transferase [Nocardioides sp. Kera G14]UDY23361.1 leucyl/phenylalanyl-tRNA--protein transferase [Nocardioides sp. Kera G14]
MSERSPVEPEPSRWVFGDPDDEQLDDLVALGADLSPGTVLAAYRRGLFPMPGTRRRDPLHWFSPVQRGVLPLDGLRVPRSLRKSAKHFEIRVDTCFDEVVAACADPTRDGGWIDTRIREAYGDLHRLGWAHSIEAWTLGTDGAAPRLAGGLYGLAIGGLFAGESMFHRERDASKVALMGLVDILGADGVAGRLLDVQWQTDHLATLGVVEIPRSEYLRRLAVALELPPIAWPQTT